MSSAPRASAVDPPPPPDTAPPSRAKPIVPFVLLLATVLVPTLFWFQNSFARELSDERLAAYLDARASATEVQHAVTELSRRIEAESRGAAPKGKPASAFYESVAALGKAEGPDGAAKRQSAAWLMQFDARADVFRRALHALLADPAPLVRWNAATSLSRFGDPAARPALLEMLRPYDVLASTAGTFHADAVLEETMGVGSGGRLGTVTTTAGKMEILSPVLGRVMSLATDGKAVVPGDMLARLAPSQAAGMNAMAALALPGMGRPEDVAVIEEFLRHQPTLQPQVEKQAQATKSALRGDAPASR
jgi:HEAT repeat protein